MVEGRSLKMSLLDISSETWLIIFCHDIWRVFWEEQTNNRLFLKDAIWLLSCSACQVQQQWEMLLLTTIKESKLHVPACLPSPLGCGSLSIWHSVPLLLSPSMHLPSTSWLPFSVFPGHSLLFFSTLSATALWDFNCVHTNIDVFSLMSIHYISIIRCIGSPQTPCHLFFSSYFSFKSCVIFSVVSIVN